LIGTEARPRMNPDVRLALHLNGAADKSPDYPDQELHW